MIFIAQTLVVDLPINLLVGKGNVVLLKSPGLLSEYLLCISAFHGLFLNRVLWSGLLTPFA